MPMRTVRCRAFRAEEIMHETSLVDPDDRNGGYR